MTAFDESAFSTSAFASTAFALGAGTPADTTARRFRSLIAPPLSFTSDAAAPVRFVSRPSQ